MLTDREEWEEAGVSHIIEAPAQPFETIYDAFKQRYMSLSLMLFRILLYDIIIF